MSSTLSADSSSFTPRSACCQMSHSSGEVELGSLLMNVYAIVGNLPYGNQK